MNSRITLIAAAVTACLLATSCANLTRTEREFGNSVRAVSTGQIFDLGAAQYPRKEAVTGAHPDLLEEAVNAYTERMSTGQVAGGLDR